MVISFATVLVVQSANADTKAKNTFQIMGRFDILIRSSVYLSYYIPYACEIWSLKCLKESGAFHYANFSPSQPAHPGKNFI